MKSLKVVPLQSSLTGTCGRGAELNDGDISWDGKTFHNKPVDAVTLAMWVKVLKGGTINWFASGDQGTTFYTSTKDATIPAKVWTHVTGSYDSATGTMISRDAGEGDAEGQGPLPFLKGARGFRNALPYLFLFYISDCISAWKYNWRHFMFKIDRIHLIALLPYQYKASTQQYNQYMIGKEDNKYLLNMSSVLIRSCLAPLVLLLLRRPW